MKLPGWKKKDLWRFTKEAYPKYGDLELFCKFDLELTLSDIAPENVPYDKVVLLLIDRLDAQNALGQFIQAAAKDRPKNQDFAELAWQYPLLSDLAERLRDHEEAGDEVTRCHVEAQPAGGWHSRLRPGPPPPMPCAWDLVSATVAPANPRVPLLVFVRGLARLYGDLQAPLMNVDEQVR
jgi:hypothetical protein